MGEVDGKRPDGFDYGNSPYEVSQVDFTGKHIVQSTRAGTVGVASASQCRDHLSGITGCRPSHRQRRAGRRPALRLKSSPWGTRGRYRSDEDEQCALYLRNLLQGRQPDPEAVRSLVLTGNDTPKFFDESQPQYHPQDVELALQISRYPFAMKVRREDGLPVARKYTL